MKDAWILCVILLLFLVPSKSFAESNGGTISGDEKMRITSDDGRYSLDIAGRFQLRYEYLNSDLQDDHSSFFLRRLQPDIQGHAFDPNLRFRLMVDLSGGATLFDAWVAYSFHDALNIRAGQFNIPFT